MVDKEKIDRLRVQWDKSRNMFHSFLTGIDEVRREIGDDAAFGKWCFYDLGIGTISIKTLTEAWTKAAGLQDEHDAKTKNQQIEAVRRAERDQKRAAREASEAAKARIAAEQEAARNAAAKAAEQAVQQAKARTRQDNKNLYRDRSDARKRDLQLAKPVELTTELEKVSPLISNEELGKIGYKASLGMTKARAEWIESSILLAAVLVEGRKRYPSNTHFTGWLEQNNINISHQERAALLELGLDLTQLRKTLEGSHRTSLERIARDRRLEISSAVDGNA
jgi:flagellar biosynthesis GTPase FlhF